MRNIMYTLYNLNTRRHLLVRVMFKNYKFAGMLLHTIAELILVLIADDLVNKKFRRAVDGIKICIHYTTYIHIYDG